MTLYSAAYKTIRARDTANSILTATTGITINPGPLDHLALTTPTTVNAGTAFYTMISARDQYNNVVSSFADTVHFTTTDPNATVPSDTMLVNGTGTFQVTFHTKGAQKVNANDTVNTAVKGLAATTVK